MSLELLNKRLRYQGGNQYEIFIKDKLMGHRIDETTTTTKIINEGIRTKEDLIILKKFWPTPIAKLINRFYKKSEKNNSKI